LGQFRRGWVPWSEGFQDERLGDFHRHGEREFRGDSRQDLGGLRLRDSADSADQRQDHMVDAVIG
jgi:hypothetical protein